MQYKVPQDVQREDRIVGPLTFRQLIICGVGFSIAYAIYVYIGKDYEFITAIIPTILIGIITVVFAFLNPLDLHFEKYILYLIASWILPSKRYWIKGTGDPSRMVYVPAINKEKKKIDEKTTEKDAAKKKKNLAELSKILDQKII